MKKAPWLAQAVVVKPGEWLPLGSQSCFSVCCDCGLVHRDEYAVQILAGTGKKLEVRMYSRHWRDNRKTAQKRREKKRKGEKLPGEK